MPKEIELQWTFESRRNNGNTWIPIVSVVVIVIAVLACIAVYDHPPEITGEPTPELIAEFDEYASRGEKELQAAWDALKEAYEETHMIRYGAPPNEGFVLYPL